MRIVLAGVATLALLAGCARTTETVAEPMPSSGTADDMGAETTLRDAGGIEKGRATITTAGDAMRLTLDVQGMPPGPHGVHFHTVGRCDPPSFEGAGPHWNPTGRQHGRDNPQGAHAGDVPNISVDGNGRGTLTVDVPGSLASLMDADGAALIVHAAPDDYRTDPSGNSGARLACGVLARSS